MRYIVSFILAVGCSLAVSYFEFYLYLHKIADLSGNVVKLSMMVAFALSFTFFVAISGWVYRVSFERTSFAAPDPNKWSFNQQTGEYHRITFTSGTRRLIDTRSWHEISTERLKSIREFRRSTVTAAISLIVAACSAFALIMSINGNHATDNTIAAALVLFFSGALCLVSGIASLATYAKLQGSSLELPPQPTPQPGIEEVKQNKAHGSARFATPEEINAAGLGGGTASLDDREF